MVLTDNANGFKIQKNMLMMTGLWPIENKTWIYKIKTLMSWITALILSITMWMEVLTNLHDLSKVSQILYILVTIMCYIAKLAAFCYCHKTVLELLDYLKNPLFTSYPKQFDYHMAKTVKQSTVLAKSYQVLVGCCVILMGVFPIFDKKPLPFPFPYDFGNYRFLMYAFQLFSLGICAWNNSSLDVLCISFMGIASAQLDILMKRIDTIEPNKYNCADKFRSIHDRAVSKKLKQCVQHHLVIIELVDFIEKIFSIGIFAQFLASGIVICNVLFHFVLSELIVNACYTFNWYDYGPLVRKYIFIIMERSKKPLRISALKFSSVSIQSLTSILQWSYSLLTLLLQVHRTKN